MNNIVVFSPPRFTDEIWLPALWSQSKTYYELNGANVDKWNWIPCYADIYANDLNKLKSFILEVKPDIFAISLYVWSSEIAFTVAKWVKSIYPKCIIISGGPHQHFHYDNNWFKNHPYIDASIPGSNYGEIAFTELLDNYNNGNVIWNNISDVRYQKDTILFSSPKQLDRKSKRNFNYKWPIFANQQNEILDFIKIQHDHLPKSKTLTIYESTRGCPYGCTYCDWGGGISSNVIQRDIEYIKEDFNFLTKLKLAYLYFADANLGIFKDRDVNIIKELIYFKELNNSSLHTGYGGFAKSTNRLEYIKQILTLDLEHNLSVMNEIKISLQSFDNNILKNINRVSIPLEKQINAFESLTINYSLPLYVELISGLPGLTKDIFYSELNTLGEQNLSAVWYDWLLLPETPAYDPVYRNKFKIQTITKRAGWGTPESGAFREIVVGTSSYSTIDYFEMLLATSMYHATLTGGYYNQSLKWIFNKYNIRIGDLIQNMFNSLYNINNVIDQWENIQADLDLTCYLKAGEFSTFAGWWFIMVAVTNFNSFNDQFNNWIRDEYKVPFFIRQFDRLNISTISTQYELDKLIDIFRQYNNKGHALLKLPFNTI